MMVKYYSENEYKMLSCFGLKHIMDLTDTPVSDVYRIAVETAFLIIGGDDPQTRALRRCFAAVKNGTPHRLTPEFEKIAEFK